MRELSRDLLPHDDLTIWVPANTWTCVLCDPPGCATCGLAKRDRHEGHIYEERANGARTTVAWLGKDTDGPDGRCGRCGAKFRLAVMGESVPSVEEQLAERR